MPGERTLLVVSGGTEALSGIARAREMGLHVVVSDGSPTAPGLLAGDDRLLASTYDIEATVAAAQRYDREVRRIDGVMCIASDVPVTVASVAAELGLPGVPPETARLAADKLALKRRLTDRGVATPVFAQVATVLDLRAHAADHGYPLVVKPVDSRGARGVLLLRDAAFDLEWAYETARGESPTGRVMVERFLEGPQISTESLVVDGVAHTIGLADRNYEYLERFAPYVIENGGELPSKLSAATRAQVDDLIQQVVEALGMVRGVLKGDVVICDDVPHLIEAAVRLSGGYLCSHEIPLSTGVDFLCQAIRIALGETPAAADLQSTLNTGVAQRWLFPTPGRVSLATGAATAAARAGIALCEVRVKPGDLVPPVSSHSARAAVVIATAATRELAIEQAGAALADIRIQTEPC